jgi:hypothetical protein
MSEIKDGGPAFPVSTRSAGEPHEGTYGHQDDYDTWQFGGLTMRDYFAAKAIHAVLTSPRFENCYDAALMAYRMADAMLRARSQS